MSVVTFFLYYKCNLFKKGAGFTSLYSLLYIGFITKRKKLHASLCNYLFCYWRFSVYDDGLITLVLDEVFLPRVVWKLGDVQVSLYFLPYATQLKYILNCRSKNLEHRLHVGSLELWTATNRFSDAYMWKSGSFGSNG